MKKILFAFILVATSWLNLNVHAQSIIQGTEDEVKTLLLNKWKMRVMEYQGINKKMPADKSVYFTFKKNGKVSLSADGKSHEEYWTYDHSTKTITVKENKDIKRKDEFEIIEVSSKTLVLNTNSEGIIATIRFTVVN